MKIFVAKLDYSTDSETLRDLFEGYGTVSSANVIIDKATGKSRGFGFVEMPKDHEAKKAMVELHETKLDGRTIVVKEARERDS